MQNDHGRTERNGKKLEIIEWKWIRKKSENQQALSITLSEDNEEDYETVELN